MLILPRGVFSSPEQEEEWRAFIRARLPVDE
jgi:hypothetical protein